MQIKEQFALNWSKDLMPD